MEKELKNITFTVIENGTQIPISTRHGSYPNLMYLLKEELQLESFGECGGVGRCATCVITTKGLTGAAAIKERNEPTTLEKLGHSDEATRLSCQIYITPDLDGAEITILEI
ncbi:2Fe-2S iron-sulfur cluster binding domain-containing protein [Flavobacterium sufflavum]|uniref:2Fe-2S iron-sulfur cluster binding domain-containing protein n=1 Tax=Flavobacterium sufflavum TaxID=1921138 RepID=A0A437L3F5_9FLAO|nr:2Fe-2S iron-sulfur cluster-binding protein [Flavobacterium sufflavum]RVT79838.1 2Fe-2S iron-sulfur cluster binding domain-containing protein [Flavobacterium sufflavum]